MRWGTSLDFQRLETISSQKSLTVTFFYLLIFYWMNIVEQDYMCKTLQSPTINTQI